MKLKRFLTLFTLCTALFMTTLSAQPGGGGGMGGPGGGMGGPGMGGPEGMSRSSSVDPVAMTGYFDIDVDKMIKKCKVKSESEKSAIRKAFADFVIGSGNVYTSHSEEFIALEEMKEQMAAAQESGAVSDDMRSNMRNMMSSTMAIKREMMPLHKTLNASVESILVNNEKSLSRWKLYYEDICSANNYSEKEPRQRGEGGERSGSGQRGEGGMGPGGMGGMGGMGGGGF